MDRENTLPVETCLDLWRENAFTADESIMKNKRANGHLWYMRLWKYYLYLRYRRYPVVLTQREKWIIIRTAIISGKSGYILLLDNLMITVQFIFIRNIGTGTVKSKMDRNRFLRSENIFLWLLHTLSSIRDKVGWKSSKNRIFKIMKRPYWALL